MAQNLIGALNAGSGVDVTQLAKDLVEASRAPQKALIDDKISKAQASISGYGVVQFALTEIRKGFDALKDAAGFNVLKVSNTQEDAIALTPSAAAVVGMHRIEVLGLRSEQRSLSNGFAAADTDLGATSISLALEQDGSTVSIAVDENTPEGIVRAINAADTDVRAELVNVGGTQPWRIVVAGSPGAANAFTLSANLDPALLRFDTELAAASDASLRVDGLTYQRSTNTIDDIIPGVTLDLRAVSSGEARIALTRDTSGLTEKMRTLVSAYNDFAESVEILGDRDSTVEEFGGALAGDSLLGQIRRQMEGLLRTSTATDGAIRSPRDLGLFFVEGRLTFDETRWSTAVTTQFGGVVDLMTGSGAAEGIGKRAVSAIDALLDPRTGFIAQQKLSAERRITGYEVRLERLESQMEKLLDRYTRQFTLMEGIVGTSNSLRENLKGTFEGLAAMYTRR